MPIEKKKCMYTKCIQNVIEFLFLFFIQPFFLKWWQNSLLETQGISKQIQEIKKKEHFLYKKQS